jgi:Zn-dependent alcohol dehydrogenase
MKAAVCTAIDTLELQDIDMPEPGPDEVRVRIATAGICHTDLSVMRGNFDVPMPVVLGHEGSGYVDKVGPGVTQLGVGDPIVCSIIMPCGSCSQCDRGALSVCDRWFEVAFSGVMPDGTSRLERNGERINSFFCQSSFAEYAVVPVSGAIKVRRDVELQKVAGLSCGISTGLGASMVRAPVEPGSVVAVLGAGGVGIATMLGARAQRAKRVIAIDQVSSKLDAALSLGAATDVIIAGPDVIEDILRLTPSGTGVDFFYDAVGAPSTLETGIAATRNGGTVCAIGIMRGDIEYSVPLRGLINEKIITGTNGGSIMPRRDIPRFIDLMMMNELPFDRITDRFYPLEGIEQAFLDLEAHQFTRAAILFEDL